MLQSLNDHEIKIVWSFSILDNDGDKFVTRDSEHNFTKNGETFGFKCFTDRSTFIEKIGEEETKLEIRLEVYIWQ